MNLIVGGSEVANVAISSSLAKSCINAKRPNNIGVGQWKKLIEKDLNSIAKWSKCSSKIFNFISVAGVALDAGVGIYDNVKNNAPIKKIVIDAGVDVAVSGSIIIASTAIGTAICPLVGTVTGTVVGVVIGLGANYCINTWEIRGTTESGWIKERLYSLC